MEVYESPVNVGYGAACNQGLAHAQGEYWCVANLDTEWSADVLTRLIETARQFSNALINPAILQPNGLVNAYGNTMHVTGITTCSALGEAYSPHGERYRFPLLASGAMIVAHYHVWQRLQGFDPDYFLYLEDANLSLRAALLKIPVVCDTWARIVHHYDLKMSSQKFYWLERNRLLTLLLILEKRTLKRLLLSLIITETATWIFALMHGPQYVRARIQGYRWLWRHRTQWKKNRRVIQESRQIPDTALLRRMTFELPLGQLTSNSRLIRYINHWLGKIYEALLPKEASLCE